MNFASKVFPLLNLLLVNPVQAHFTLPSHQAILKQYNGCSIRFVLPNETKTIDTFKSLLSHLSVQKSLYFTATLDIFLDYQRKIGKDYKSQQPQQLEAHYSTCFTIFFFRSENWFKYHPKKRASILHHLLANHVVNTFGEDPKFITYVSVTDETKETDYNDLYKSGVSSKFYLITPSRGFMLCIHCESKLYPSDETMTWTELYRSNLGKVPMEYIGGKAYFKYNCEVYNLRISIRANGAEFCILHELRKKFNLTDHKDRVEYNKFAIISGEYMYMSKWKKNKRWGDHTMISVEFTQAGMDIEHYEFGSIISSTIRTTEILLGPLDTHTWMILGIILLSISIFIGISTQSFQQAFKVWCILLEQGTFMTRRFKGSNHHAFRAQVSIGATVLWTFMAIVISNGYKGRLFSLITSPGSVSYPNSVEALVNSESMLFSTSGWSIPEKIDLFLKSKNVEVKMNARYRKLKERLHIVRDYQHMVDNRWYGVIAMYTPMDLISNMVNNKIMESNGDNITIPSTRINYLDTKRNMEMAYLFVKVYTKYIFKYGGQVFMAPTARQWIFKRSYFTWYFKPFFQGIDNSGIHHRWAFHHDVHERLLYMKKIAKRLEEGKDQIHKRKAIKMSPITFLLNHKILSALVDHENLEKALSLHVFSVFLLLLAYSILVGIIVFGAEMIWGKVFRAKVQAMNRLDSN